MLHRNESRRSKRKKKRKTLECNELDKKTQLFLIKNIICLDRGISNFKMRSKVARRYSVHLNYKMIGISESGFKEPEFPVP